MKFSGSVGWFHGGARRTGNGRTILCVPVSRLSAEGTLENPTTEWVPKVQSGSSPIRQSLRQKYGDDESPDSVGRGLFQYLFSRDAVDDGAFFIYFSFRKKNRDAAGASRF